jgi:hypothetical protein
MFANMNNKFVVVKTLQSGADKPITLKYKPELIENRLAQNVTALQQMRDMANRLTEESPERLQLEHAISNLRRRISDDINKMKEIGLDVRQYEEIRETPIPRREQPLPSRSVTTPEPIGSAKQSMPTFEPSMLTQTLLPGIPAAVTHDSVYKIGLAKLGGRPSNSYESKLSEIMLGGK